MPAATIEENRAFFAQLDGAEKVHSGRISVMHGKPVDGHVAAVVLREGDIEDGIAVIHYMNLKSLNELIQVLGETRNEILREKLDK